MNETAELMARRERHRVKQAVLSAAENRCFVTVAGKSKASILFNAYGSNIDMALYSYATAERRQIIRELTLEIIDELMEGLASTKDRILRGGEI